MFNQDTCLANERITVGLSFYGRTEQLGFRSKFAKNGEKGLHQINEGVFQSRLYEEHQPGSDTPLS